MMNFYDPNQWWMNNGYDPYKGMNEDERMRASIVQCIIVIVAALIAIGICGIFSSCAPQERIIVDYRTVHDTTYVAKVQRDSIHVTDSVFVSDMVRHDTVWRTTERWHTQWRDRWRTDTLWRATTDTVAVVQENIVEREASLTWWQQTRIHLADIMLFVLAIVAIVKIGRRHINLMK